MMTSEFHLTQRIIQTLPTTTADDRTFPNPSIDTYIRKGGKRSDYGREGGDWANLYNNAQRKVRGEQDADCCCRQISEEDKRNNVT